MYRKIEKCRICGNTELVKVLDLGEQMLTGVFPASRDESITRGPLRLVKCFGEERKVCGLLQLAHSYESHEMYGDNYGYRSGLNESMVAHLNKKVEDILGRVELEANSLIVDIGSNDGTTLKAYDTDRFDLVGIDPTGTKFHEYYPPHIKLVPDFFSATKFKGLFGEKRASVITSFSMFYDLESPLEFMKDVYEVLHDKGVWVFEQSYMPQMLEQNSYDTVCHEHLEYYSLKQIKWMTDLTGFSIRDVEFNMVNGGSFSVTVEKKTKQSVESPIVDEIIENERQLGLNTLDPYNAFAVRIANTKRILREWIDSVRSEGGSIGALGASTKGNVLLQYCDITSEDISFIGEINDEKVDRLTPGSWIPIVSEAEAIGREPNYLVILPWHFKNSFLSNPKLAGMSLVFPLPMLQIEVPSVKY